MERKDPNQGEGDRASAVRYDKHVEDFVAEGRVPEAAKQAEQYVEREPEDATKAEARAKQGPHPARWLKDELVAKGRSIFHRVRARLARK